MTDSITPTAELISRIAPQHRDEFWFLGGQPRLSPSRDRLAGLRRVWLRRVLRCARSG
jgi:LacI family sucrose operon transcriptional repressor